MCLFYHCTFQRAISVLDNKSQSQDNKQRGCWRGRSLYIYMYQITNPKGWRNRSLYVYMYQITNPKVRITNNVAVLLEEYVFVFLYVSDNKSQSQDNKQHGCWRCRCLYIYRYQITNPKGWRGMSLYVSMYQITNPKIRITNNVAVGKICLCISICIR